jgi:excisionase family DNA binding protein
MVKKILQIENTQSSEFITKIIDEFKYAVKKQHKTSECEEVLLTRVEAAKMLSISLPTLWKFTKDDVIPAYRIGTRVRYKKTDILESLKKMNKF